MRGTRHHEYFVHIQARNLHNSTTVAQHFGKSPNTSCSGRGSPGWCRKLLEHRGKQALLLHLPLHVSATAPTESLSKNPVRAASERKRAASRQSKRTAFATGGVNRVRLCRRESGGRSPPLVPGKSLSDFCSGSEVIRHSTSGGLYGVAVMLSLSTGAGSVCTTTSATVGSSPLMAASTACAATCATATVVSGCT